MNSEKGTSKGEIEIEGDAFSIAPGEVVISTFIGLDEMGQALIELPGLFNKKKVQAAQATISLSQSSIGRQVVVMFIDGDIMQPIITGLVRSPLYDIIENAKRPLDDINLNKDLSENKALNAYSSENSESSSKLKKEEQLVVDGKKVLIEGSQEVVLKCGDSSITLTQSGKILIRGKYLLNRSSGVNRIMGGSVQVN